MVIPASCRTACRMRVQTSVIRLARLLLGLLLMYFTYFHLTCWKPCSGQNDLDLV